jgi:hypothetical protein
LAAFDRAPLGGFRDGTRGLFRALRRLVGRSVSGCYGPEESLARPHRETKFFEVLLGQVDKIVNLDLILDKYRGVLA